MFSVEITKSRRGRLPWLALDTERRFSRGMAVAIMLTSIVSDYFSSKRPGCIGSQQAAQ
jgi:hypothetical protein